MVPTQELNRYAELLTVANKADQLYQACWKTKHLLRKVKLPYMLGRMWVTDQDGIFFILKGVRQQLPVGGEQCMWHLNATACVQTRGCSVNSP